MVGWIRRQEGKSKEMYILFLSARCSLLRAEGFCCSLYVLHGGQGINKLKCLILKIGFF
jgi:hypothetical protein